MTTTTDPIMTADSPVTMLANTDTMSGWSEEKKAEFSNLFEQRTEIARILCKITVSKLANMARSRHFISEYHLTKLQRATGWQPMPEYRYHYQYKVQECGRDIDEIIRIADERAKALLAELPPLKKAVQVIDAQTAANLDKIDKLKKKAEKLQEELEELPCTIDMEDPEFQDMTVRQFRAEVKTLFDKRNKLIDSINKAGSEAHNLEIAVSKALYKGLPGLSEAVVDVLKVHIERITVLDQMKRRVTEQVKFGDSEAATGLLAQFEKDEAEVSTELKSKLNAAMSSLKEKVKALPKKKRATKAVAGKKTTKKKTAKKRSRGGK